MRKLQKVQTKTHIKERKPRTLVLLVLWKS